jgi:hypothetical protein
MSRNQHVVPYDGRWAVRAEGNIKVRSVHESRKDAINAARNCISSREYGVIVHGRDGKIRDKMSNNNLFPPRF